MSQVLFVNWLAKLTEDGDPETCPENENFDIWKIGTNEIGGVYKVSEDRKTMTKAYGHNKFSNEPRSVPINAEFEELSDDQIDYFCRDSRPDPKLNDFELAKWEEHVRYECFTIRDVLDLKKGDKVRFLVMDRNLYDIVCSNNEGNKLFDPEYFFRCNSVTYTHDSGVKGTMVYHWGGLGPERSDSKEYKNWEFEIEYEKDKWYPLKGGYLPASDPQKFASFHYEDKKHWSTFPKSTRLGWRGPMMVWEKVKHQPNIYWYEE